MPNEHTVAALVAAIRRNRGLQIAIFYLLVRQLLVKVPISFVKDREPNNCHRFNSGQAPSAACQQKCERSLHCVNVKPPVPLDVG